MPVRARTGGPVLTMHLSASHATTLGGTKVPAVPTSAGGGGAGGGGAGGGGAGGEAIAAERAAKRHRSADPPAGVAQIQTEEGDWASSCFAEGDQLDLPSVLDPDLTWQ